MHATLQTANLVLTGLDSIQKIGGEARKFGEKALIVCDKGIVETGLLMVLKP